ncbi:MULTISPECIES: DUF4376 domain-containing protein [unclassified Vibrio]|uniref:DUF4376 domain-containing protein n=1 Tax=unclassified Vibrio TaxID=2614977 RepID=UPI001481E7B6|nr:MULTISPECIES: DUF4376 domain-containing protein [unclassified Vibrio]NNN44718.1 DUF4376 domain-containing protein [Vibrio sp. 1-1(7)]NNN72091.1 DUF4376 domain-containing protein [Vibrio sp. 12-2(3-a)]
MFNDTRGVLADLPAPIQTFYKEEVRQEPTGNKIPESYTYFDEEGVERTGERLVNEYESIIYLVEKSRHDLKTWGFVEQVKLRNNYDFTRYCIEKACEAEEWLFHDDYLEWLNKEPKKEDEKYLVEDKEGELVYNYEDDLATWKSLEPVNNATKVNDVLVNWHQELAKITREQLTESPIVVNGFTWQVDKIARDNINECIAYADRNNLDNYSVSWILADNSVKETNLAELKAVIDAYTERLGYVVNKYAEWREGDKLERFN